MWARVSGALVSVWNRWKTDGYVDRKCEYMYRMQNTVDHTSVAELARIVGVEKAQVVGLEKARIVGGEKASPQQG